MSDGMWEASKTIRKTARQRETDLRYATVLSVQSGPPRTCTVDLGGTTYSGVPLAAHVNPVVNSGLYIADLGGGRWLGMAVVG